MIKLCTTADEISQIYDILENRKRVSARNLESLSPRNEFIERFLKHLTTYAYFEDGKITAFLSSALLKEIPSWYVFLVGTRDKQGMFDIKNTKIPDVVDATLEHWESKNIFSVVFSQSVTHRSKLNGESIATVSEKMKEYTNPGATLEVIPKGELSKFSMINDRICQGVRFPTDMVIKWSFRKDCFNDYE